MASPSAGSSRKGAPLPHNAAGAAVDTTQLEKLCEKALAAEKCCRYVLASAFFRRAAEEALRLHGDTFICTYLTLQRADCLVNQAQLEGVRLSNETTALCAEAWALVSGCLPLLVRRGAALRVEAWALASSCLPLIARRIDANTMLPGRGTAVELEFYKRFEVTRRATFDLPPLSTHNQQLFGLSFGYATVVFAAHLMLLLLPLHQTFEAQSFVLRVVDCMLPAARSLPNATLPSEISFAATVQRALSNTWYNATFIASLRTKWTAAAMIQMRRERRLLDASETVQNVLKGDKTRWRADVAQHGFKHCALPACDKREASVQQYTGRSTSRCAAQPRPRSRLRMTQARARALHEAPGKVSVHRRRVVVDLLFCVESLVPFIV